MKGRKVEASTILEALHDLGASFRAFMLETHGSDLEKGFTVAEIATAAGVSRNTASDRLFELAQHGFLVTKARRPLAEHAKGRNSGPSPVVYTITSNGIAGVALVRRKLGRLASDVDVATQGERFDRAAEILEHEAEAIEARLAKELTLPEVDPRQIALPIAIDVYGIMSRTTIEQDAWERRDEQARFEIAAGGGA